MTNSIDSVAGVDDFATMVKDLMAERDKLQADLAAARATIDTMQGGYDRAAAMIIDLRAQLAEARALLYRAYPYIEDVQYGSDEMHLAKRTLLSDIDAALAGERKP